MAQIPAPGVAQASWKGFIASQPWACVTHWQFKGTTQAWAVTDIQNLADTLSTSWNTRLGTHMGSDVTLQTTDTVDLGSVTPAIGTNSTVRTGAGGGGKVFGAHTACLINFHLAARYKGGHPRIYLPAGVQGDIANEFEWGTAFLTAMNTAWGNIRSDVANAILPIGGAQVVQVCPRYSYTYTPDTVHHKYHKVRSGYVGSFEVTGQTTARTFGTQRRRLHI